VKLVGILLKVTPTERANIRLDAYAKGMNVTEYLKYLINKERNNNEIGKK
jgi:hypothetical protein